MSYWLPYDSFPFSEDFTTPFDDNIPEPDVIELLCIWDGTFDSDNLTVFSELFLIDESSISVTPRSMQSYILTSWQLDGMFQYLLMYSYKSMFSGMLLFLIKIT